MARRGLVSKNFGPGSDGGKPAPGGLPTKQGPRVNLLTLEQAASQLRVPKETVREWMKVGLIKSDRDRTGIRPYDLNKFKLDHADEIAEARKRPKPVPKVEQKPQKESIFKRMFSIFSRGDRPPSAKPTRAENQQLKNAKRQLREATTRIQKLEKDLAEKSQPVSGGAAEGPNQADVRRLKELEIEASKIPALEAELMQLRNQPLDDQALQEAHDQIQMLQIQLAQAEGEGRQNVERVREMETRLQAQAQAHAQAEQQPMSPDASEEVARLQHEVAQLRQQLQTAGQGGVDEQHVQELRQALSEAQDYNERAFQMFTESESQRNELTQTVQRLQAELASVAGGGASTDPRLAEMEKELLEARERLSFAGPQLQQLKSEREELARRYEAMAREVESKNRDLREAQDKLQRATREIEVRNELIERLENNPGEIQEMPSQELDTLRTELAEAQKLLLSQRGRIRQLEATQAETPSQTELVDQLASTRVELNSLRRSNEVIRLAKARLESQVEELRRQLEEREVSRAPVDSSGDAELLRQETRKLLAANQSLEAELRAAREELRLQKAREATSQEGIAHQQISHLQRTVSARDSQVKKLAAKLAEMERSLGKAHSESTRLTEQLLQREERLKTLEEEVERRHEDRIKMMERQITGLEWKLSLRDDRISALEQELARGSRVLPPPIRGSADQDNPGI